MANENLIVEALEERIAPAIMTVMPPAGPTGELPVPHAVDDHAVAADGENGVIVE